MQAFSSAVEVLRVARKLGAAEQFDYSVISLCDAKVEASNGLSILANMDIETLPSDSIVVVVAGAGVEKTDNPKLLATLRYLGRHGHQIWAISSGVVRLAQAGLIDDCKVAAHWEDVPYLKAHHPRVNVSSAIFIPNEPHPTCAGGGAAADLFMHYIKTHGPDGLVADIASRLMIDGVRDGRVRQNFPAELQFSTSNQKAFAAIQIMLRARYDPISIASIAAQLNVSQRQLERLFHTEFDQTPGVVYLRLRMDEARQEVLMGHRAIVDIALDYGFQPGNFTKVYKRVFNVTPAKDRAAKKVM
jgi:transcriptional regulator GlxA family with amidase domain